jgi:hypothetical protein
MSHGVRTVRKPTMQFLALFVERLDFVCNYYVPLLAIGKHNRDTLFHIDLSYDRLDLKSERLTYQSSALLIRVVLSRKKMAA